MSEKTADTYRACGFFMLRAPALPARPMLELLRSLPVADADPLAPGDLDRDAVHDRQTTDVAGDEVLHGEPADVAHAGMSPR